MLGNRGFPEAWSCLCICQASFLMTFAMGRVPHAGPWHVTTVEFSKFVGILSAVLYWHLFFRIWNSSAGIPSPPLALFIVMPSKAHLTSHSRMSGSGWVITPSWSSGSWRALLYTSSVYSCHLFLISYASVRSILFLSFICAHLCMKCSLGISDSLKEIPSLPHSVVFLYFSLFT